MAPKMRILYEGVKNFPQRHCSLNIMILKYDNCDECFEIIAYDIISWQEVPRVYINIWALNALISKRKILNGPKQISSLSDIKIDESEQIELLLSRLIVKNDTAVRVVELTFESFDHDRVCVRGKLVYLDMVQVKPPDLEIYRLPNIEVLRAKTFDAMMREKEKAKKKEHDKALLSNVIKIFNTERHVEYRPKIMSEDEKAILHMKRVQFDLDFQLKPFDRELARSRWLKAISRILYSILYVKILNRLDVYQWFTRPKETNDIKNAINLKYKSRASFTDDDYMYGAGTKKKMSPTNKRMQHTDDSHILESFTPIQHSKPFKAFNYGPITTTSTLPSSFTSKTPTLPLIAPMHIGDVVRTLAPVFDHDGDADLIDKLTGTKDTNPHHHHHEHKPKVQEHVYHHEDHDYFPCNIFHPHHLNTYPDSTINRDNKDNNHNNNNTANGNKTILQENKGEEKKADNEQEDEKSDILSPRTPRFRTLPTLTEGNDRSSPSGIEQFKSMNIKVHVPPDHDYHHHLHTKNGKSDHKLHNEDRRHSVGNTDHKRLSPVHTSDRRTSHGQIDHHSQDKKLSPLHHTPKGGTDSRRHSTAGHEPQSIGLHPDINSSRRSSLSGESPSVQRDLHTALPSISSASGKHNNHIHGLKLVKKVGSFKLSTAEKHDMLIASVNPNLTSNKDEKAPNTGRSNHLRVLKDIKSAQESAPPNDFEDDKDEDWGYTEDD